MQFKIEPDKRSRTVPKQKMRDSYFTQSAFFRKAKELQLNPTVDTVRTAKPITILHDQKAQGAKTLNQSALLEGRSKDRIYLEESDRQSGPMENIRAHLSRYEQKRLLNWSHIDAKQDPRATRTFSRTHAPPDFTSRPVTQGTQFSGTTRAAGRISNGRAAGASGASDFSFDSFLMTPVGKSGIMTPFSAKKELVNTKGEHHKFSNENKSMVQLPASRETDFSAPRTSIGNTKKGAYNGGPSDLVKVNAFTENLQQKVRYMLSKNQKYKATDTLNLKRPNVDTFQRLKPMTRTEGAYTPNRTGGASIWDRFAQPQRATASNQSSTGTYDLITQERRDTRKIDNSLQKWMQFRRQKGFSNFVHSSRTTSTNFNPEYHKMFNNLKEGESPFKRSGGMCSRLIDVAHTNTFLARPFKR